MKIKQFETKRPKEIFFFSKKVWNCNILTYVAYIETIEFSKIIVYLYFQSEFT